MAYVAAMIFRPTHILAALALLAAPATAAPAKPKAAQSAMLSVDALLADARIAAGKGEVELALRLAQAAIVADPARPTSYVALGDIYAVSGQAEYARSFYEAALQIDPQEPAAVKAIAALDKTKPSTQANAAQ